MEETSKVDLGYASFPQLDIEKVWIENDVKRFIVVHETELEDRMDVDLWKDAINNMSIERKELSQSPYNIIKLLGK